jgi:hypothetical protein
MKFSQSHKPYFSSSSSSARQYERQSYKNKVAKKTSSWKKINQFNMLNVLMAFADGSQFEEEMPSMIKVRLILRNIVIKDEDNNEYSQEEAVRLLAEALLQGRGINTYLFLNEDGSYGGNGRINIKNLIEEQEQEDEDYVETKLVNKTKADRSHTTSSGRGYRKSAAQQFDDNNPDSPSILPNTTDDEDDYVVVDE